MCVCAECPVLGQWFCSSFVDFCAPIDFLAVEVNKKKTTAEEKRMEVHKAAPFSQMCPLHSSLPHFMFLWHSYQPSQFVAFFDVCFFLGSFSLSHRRYFFRIIALWAIQTDRANIFSSSRFCVPVQLWNTRQRFFVSVKKAILKPKSFRIFRFPSLFVLLPYHRLFGHFQTNESN